MAKNLTKKVASKIERIQALLHQLQVDGYILDFVEDSHCIVEVKSLKVEMEKNAKSHHSHIDTDEYVVAVLK